MPALQSHLVFPEIKHMLLVSLAAFEDVSDNIDISSVRTMQKNKLYGNYGEAISLAKLLLKRYDYTIDNIESDNHLIPPFWIDMSRLYEVYVYSLLQKAYPRQIKFQVKGCCQTAVDFLKLDEELIIDAKYKPRYDYSNSELLDDIREISGYARDENILRELGVSNNNLVPNCLIIYPIMEGCRTITVFDEGSPLLPEATPFNSFRRFHKICVPVPRIAR